MVSSNWGKNQSWFLGHKQSALQLLTCVMLAQSIPISYHTEANGCIFFAAGVVGMLKNTILNNQGRGEWF